VERLGAIPPKAGDEVVRAASESDLVRHVKVLLDVIVDGSPLTGNANLRLAHVPSPGDGWGS